MTEREIEAGALAIQNLASAGRHIWLEWHEAKEAARAVLRAAERASGETARVGEYVADYSPLTKAQKAAPTGAEELLKNSVERK